MKNDSKYTDLVYRLVMVGATSVFLVGSSASGYIVKRVLDLVDAHEKTLTKLVERVEAGFKEAEKDRGYIAGQVTDIKQKVDRLERNTRKD